MGEISAVAQNEQSLGLAVESADVVEVLELSWEEVENRISALWVVTGADEVWRFVEGDGHFALRGDCLTVDSDFVSGPNPASEFFDLLVVDGDAAFVDYRFTRAARP